VEGGREEKIRFVRLPHVSGFVLVCFTLFSPVFGGDSTDHGNETGFQPLGFWLAHTCGVAAGWYGSPLALGLGGAFQRLHLLTFAVITGLSEGSEGEGTEGKWRIFLRCVPVRSTWKMGIFDVVLARMAFDVVGHQCYALTGLGNSKSTSTRPFRPGYNRSDFQSYGHRVVSMKEQSAPVLFFGLQADDRHQRFQIVFHFYMARL